MTSHPNVHFSEDRIAVLAAIQEHHFWYAPRHALLTELIARFAQQDDVLCDVGCGLGLIVRSLRAQDYQAFGIDAWAAHTLAGKREFICAKADQLPLAPASVATLTAFDVLEHLDEGPALEEFHRALSPGGRLIVSVPAYMALWSRRDELAGHQRRYNRKQLRSALEAAGFEVEMLCAYQFFLLPVFALFRLFERWIAPTKDSAVDIKPGRVVNKILMTINRIEVALNRFWRFPAGTSLIAVARKPSTLKKNNKPEGIN